MSVVCELWSIATSFWVPGGMAIAGCSAQLLLTLHLVIVYLYPIQIYQEILQSNTQYNTSNNRR